MNKLAEILSYKEKEIASFRKRDIPVNRKEKETSFVFQKAFAKASKPFLIAEVKRKSPSQGDMAMNMDPVSLALEYKDGGADALSVLTDERFFGGSFEFLREIKGVTGLPVLCKDFIIDEIQIDMAAAYGADMVLLIAEAFSDFGRLEELYQYTTSLGLDVLVEVRDLERIRYLRGKNFSFVGVNNRDLRTLEEDYRYSLSVIHELPPSAIKLSLSAFSSTKAVQEVIEVGYDGILVGTSLVKNPQRQSMIAEWKAITKRQ